jgi:hypothetical protein
MSNLRVVSPQGARRNIGDAPSTPLPLDPGNPPPPAPVTPESVPRRIPQVVAKKVAETPAVTPASQVTAAELVPNPYVPPSPEAAFVASSQETLQEMQSDEQPKVEEACGSQAREVEIEPAAVAASVAPSSEPADVVDQPDAGSVANQHAVPVSRRRVGMSDRADIAKLTAQGLTAEQIAAHLNFPVASIKRAIQQLSEAQASAPEPTVIAGLEPAVPAPAPVAAAQPPQKLEPVHISFGGLAMILRSVGRLEALTGLDGTKLAPIMVEIAQLVERENWTHTELTLVFKQCGLLR